MIFKAIFGLSVTLSLSVCSYSVYAQGRTLDGLNFTMPSDTPNFAAHTILKANTSESKYGGEHLHPYSVKDPVVMHFSKLPDKKLWAMWDCGVKGKAAAVNGVLSINTPSCYEYILNEPNGIWHQHVSNSRGWIIEAGLKINPITQSACEDGVQIWVNDHTNLVIIGFSAKEICLSYPDQVRIPFNTTNAFHAYRIESKGKQVQVYVDGSLKINHTLSASGGGSNILSFGDGDGSLTSKSLSYWDYFSYDVYP